MLVIYRVIAFITFCFVLMGLWVNFLHFASDWVMYIVMGLEG